VLVNTNLGADIDAHLDVELVVMDFAPRPPYRLIAADLIDCAHPWRHDSDKLARAVLGLLQ
jgi:hypothetical protein